MKINDKLTVEYEMEQSMSPQSKKIFSEYFELKLQVRYLYFKDIDKIKEITYKKVTDNIILINKLEEKDNGFDFFIGSHSEMNKIPPLFNKDFLLIDKRSAKLIGRDNLRSKNKYRYTQSITLVNLKKGDKIAYKGENMTIKSINKNNLILIDEKTSDKKVLSYSIVKDYIEPVEINNFQ